MPELRAAALFREHALRELRPRAWLSAVAGNRDRARADQQPRASGGRWRSREAATACAPTPSTTSATGWSAPTARAVLRGLPAQPHHSRPVGAREPRALAQDRGRQASAVLHAAEVAAAARDQGRRSGRRWPSTSSPNANAPHAVTAPVMTGHESGLITHQSRRSRRRRARAPAQPDGRALPHAARSFPSRDRALLLGPAGRAIRRASTEFRDDVRRRAAGLRRGARSSTTPTARRADWPDRFVTAYASAHPWEDFAETWAHYFHMVDTLETASAFGLQRAAAVSARARTLAAEHRFRSARRRHGPHHRSLAAADLCGQFDQPQHGHCRTSIRSCSTPAVIVKLAFVHDRIHAETGAGAGAPPTARCGRSSPASSGKVGLRRSRAV